MMKNVVLLVASIVMLLGVILIYDARIICKKDYDISKQNAAINKFKLMGLVLFVINGAIVMLVV